MNVVAIAVLVLFTVCVVGAFTWLLTRLVSGPQPPANWPHAEQHDDWSTFPQPASEQDRHEAALRRVARMQKAREGVSRVEAK